MTGYLGELTLHSDDLASLTLGDELLDQAVLECKNSKSMLPLIKQELRDKIQNRRLSSGKGELRVEFERPKTFELTEEEVERRDKRRLNNRISAMRCRCKKKREISNINQELLDLQEHNGNLRKKYERLQKEKLVIEYKLKQILSIYNCELTMKDTISAEHTQKVLPLAWELYKGISAEM